MKKLNAILALLAISPAAMALTFTADVATNNQATVTWDADGVLGMGLTVTVDSGELDDVTINGFNVFIDEAYDIASANGGALPGYTDTDLPDADPKANVDGPGMAPLSGSFALCAGYLVEENPGVLAANGSIVFEASQETQITLSKNDKRGGVVNAAGEVATNLPITFTIEVAPAECYAGQADYAEWVLAGSPECWCFSRQCHGDTDNAMAGSSRTGYYYVTADDLAVLASAYQVKDNGTVCGITPAQACADFNHARAGSSRTGYWRVDAGDLAILATYYQIKEPTIGTGVPADCLPGNRPLAQ